MGEFAQYDDIDPRIAILRRDSTIYHNINSQHMSHSSSVVNLRVNDENTGGLGKVEGNSAGF
jgi:hypothetical protein